MRISSTILVFSAVLLLPSLAACQTLESPEGEGQGVHGHPGSGMHVHDPAPPVEGVLDLGDIRDLDSIIADLAGSRVIYVGEAHNEYAHHLKQLEIIRKLHARHPDMAIGMEQFQTPFQPVLDEFVAGRLSEKEMLRRSEWYRRWRFDYRLYRPILSFARDQGIPVVALNVAKEITGEVAQQGMEGLAPEQRAAIPQEIDRSDQAYHDRLRKVFQEHPHADQQEFERFLQVQLLWDEGMAQRAADHLQQHAGRKMVVLAGSGHLSYGSGIPKRVARRLPAPYTIILPADAVPTEPGIADMLLFTGDAQLPQAGKMGVLLSESEQGVSIAEVVADSGAEEVGVKKEDLITSIDGFPVRSIADVKIEMLERKPGDRIRVTLVRRKLAVFEKKLELDVVLGE